MASGTTFSRRLHDSSMVNSAEQGVLVGQQSHHHMWRWFAASRPLTRPGKRAAIARPAPTPPAAGAACIERRTPRARPGRTRTRRQLTDWRARVGLSTTRIVLPAACQKRCLDPVGSVRDLTGRLGLATGNLRMAVAATPPQVHPGALRVHACGGSGNRRARQLGPLPADRGRARRPAQGALDDRQDANGVLCGGAAACAAGYGAADPRRGRRDSGSAGVAEPGVAFAAERGLEDFSERSNRRRSSRRTGRAPTSNESPAAPA